MCPPMIRRMFTARRSILIRRFITLHTQRGWLPRAPSLLGLVWQWERRGEEAGVGDAAGAITTSTSTTIITLSVTPTSATAATAPISAVTPATNGSTIRNIAAALLTGIRLRQRGLAAPRAATR